MDWLLPYDWAAALSASGIPRTSWGSPGPLPQRTGRRQPARSWCRHLRCQGTGHQDMMITRSGQPGLHRRMGRHWPGARWSGYAATGKALS